MNTKHLSELAVQANLVCYYGAGRRSCVGCDDYSAIEYAAYDGRTGTCGFR